MTTVKKNFNLTLGAILLLTGLIAFVFSDTLFGDSELTSYAMLLGLILAPVGLILVIGGLVQALVTPIGNRGER